MGPYTAQQKDLVHRRFEWHASQGDSFDGGWGWTTSLIEAEESGAIEPADMYNDLDYNGVKCPF